MCVYFGTYVGNDCRAVLQKGRLMSEAANLVERIVADQANLSRKFRWIAEFLVAQPDIFIRRPMRELSKTIRVSGPTLTRFCRRYGYNGLPDFRIALAMSLAGKGTLNASHLEPSIQDKAVTHRETKTAIARMAVTLVAEDRSIILDSGSTVQFLAERLSDAAPLSILTTGLNALLSLKDSSQHKLFLPGGVLRVNAMSLGGRMVENTLSGMSFDTAYIGADSIDPEFGLSTFDEEEAHLTSAMIKASRRVVVLADASKFNSPTLHRICDLEKLDILISDDSLPPETRSAIRDKGVEILLSKRSHDQSPTPAGRSQ